MTSLKYNLPIRVVTILTILFIQYCIIIGYNNVETKGHKSCRHAELIKVATTRPLCSDTETPQVTHFGYLGFIFWCMPFL